MKCGEKKLLILCPPTQPSQRPKKKSVSIFAARINLKTPKRIHLAQTFESWSKREVVHSSQSARRRLAQTGDGYCVGTRVKDKLSLRGAKSNKKKPRITWKVKTGGLILAVLYAEDAKAQEDTTSDEGAAPNSSGVTSQPKVHVTAEGVLAEMAKSGLGNDVITFYLDHADKAYAIEQVQSSLVGFCSTYSLDVVNEASRGSGLFKLSKHLPQHHSIYIAHRPRWLSIFMAIRLFNNSMLFGF